MSDPEVDLGEVYEADVVALERQAAVVEVVREGKTARRDRLLNEAVAIKGVVAALADLEEESVHRVLSIVAQLMPQQKTPEAALQDLGALAMSLGED